MVCFVSNEAGVYLFSGCLSWFVSGVEWSGVVWSGVEWSGVGVGVGWEWIGSGLGVDWEWTGVDWSGLGVDWNGLEWIGSGLGVGVGVDVLPYVLLSFFSLFLFHLHYYPPNCLHFPPTFPPHYSLNFL